MTSLCWNTSSTKLFSGDSKGCVTGLEVSTGKVCLYNAYFGVTNYLVPTVSSYFSLAVRRCKGLGASSSPARIV